MNIGEFVERLVGLGVSVSDASDVVAQAYAAGAASAPHRKTVKPTQMKMEVIDPPKKAGRLPADFVCDLDYAVQQGLSRSTAQREAERFKNFWAAKAGKDGSKLDWGATWRNWCLSTAERLGTTPRAPSGGSAMDPKKLTPEQWAPIMSIYAKTSNWNQAYGPEPGLPGSYAPQRGLF